MELWGHTINSFWKEEKYEKDSTLRRILQRIHWCNNINMISWWLFDKLRIWCYLRWFWWMEKGYEYDIIKYDVISLFCVVWVFLGVIRSDVLMYWVSSYYFQWFICTIWDLITLKGIFDSIINCKGCVIYDDIMGGCISCLCFRGELIIYYGSLEDFSLSLFLAAFVVKGI